MTASRKQREEAHATPLEKALALLDSDYNEQLEDDEFIHAVEIMQAGNNALIFTRLSGAKREIWLEKKLSKEF